MTTQHENPQPVFEGYDKERQRKLRELQKKLDEKNESQQLLIEKLKIDNAILRRDKRIILKELQKISRNAGYLATTDETAENIVNLIQLVKLMKQR